MASSSNPEIHGLSFRQNIVAIYLPNPFLQVPPLGSLGNGSHGRGTARWNPVGAGTEFVLSHNDDSKWLISHYFYTKNNV